MASNTDAAYSYNKLLGSDHDTYVNNEETTPALRSSTTPRSWSFTIITLGWAVALLSCATYATTSWHTAKELDAIHELLQQSLTTSSNPPIHVNGTASPHQPTWDHTIPSNTVINIDGVEIQGYRLGYNASYCGEMTNPAGASALGCVLDRVQGGWIPEICSDSELREVWDAMPEFRWYLDEARTQEVPQERVYRGDPDLMGRTLYTDVNYHINHCIAVLRLRNKNSMRRDRGMTYHMLSNQHIEHCFQRFSDWLTPEGVEITRLSTDIHFASAGVVKNKHARTSECYIPA